MNGTAVIKMDVKNIGGIALDSINISTVVS
jgi:hypothetical protein